MEIKELYELVILHEIATEDEINLVTNINGWSKETINSIIYARTGYHDIDQFIKYKIKK